MNTFLLILALFAIGFNIYTLKLLLNAVQKLRSQTREALHNHQAVLEKLASMHRPGNLSWLSKWDADDIAERFRKGEDIFRQVPRMRNPPGPPRRDFTGQPVPPPDRTDPEYNGRPNK